jgi:hypothetical protein
LPSSLLLALRGAGSIALGLGSEILQQGRSACADLADHGAFSSSWLHEASAALTKP